MRISDWSSDVCSSDLLWGGSSHCLKGMSTHMRYNIVGPDHRGGAGHCELSIRVHESRRTTGCEQHRHREFMAEERSEEHTSELQSLMRISYAVFCLKKNKTKQTTNNKKTINIH